MSDHAELERRPRAVLFTLRSALSFSSLTVVVFQSLCESDLELRLREAIRQRDEQWRKHEREQIVFLQNETAAMLRGLHKEIERLGYQLKDAKRQLYVPDDSPCDHSEMETKIEQQQERIRQLEQEIREKEQRVNSIDGKAAEKVEKLEEQISIQLLNGGVSCSGDLLLHDRPHRIIHRVEIRRVGWPDVPAPKPWEELLANGDRGFGGMRWCPVLLGTSAPDVFC
ncbi:unnamed protein product [Heligmosomoides polygyrus]|uniref:CCDC92 domain-containing protein n=1 Tax=Heligmosomoides polygyrus TaxID=6339 RepID=A0A3P8GBA4_HELPZ|nr:unnamed protein product [Heligmosomoides polygyrus]